MNDDNEKIIYLNKKIINDNNEKIVNYLCYCKKYFSTLENILYIVPCNHVIHESCFNNYILKTQYENLNKISSKHEKILETSENVSKYSLKCPFCQKNIKSVLTEYKINSKKKYSQYKIDIKSLRMDNSASINYMILPLSIIKFTSLINKLILVNSEKDLFSTIEYVLKAFNIKINIIDNTNKNPIEIIDNKVIWKNKKDNEKKLVLISNHAHYLDSIIMYYLFKCGFISSDFILQTDIGRIIATKLKLLIFKRGIDTNMVEKIKEYLNETKRIAIFPEGVLVNNETMIKFRTGAFYTGESICPIILKYNQIIYDDDFNLMLFKLITQPEIIINVYINDFYHPPFDDKKIEKIRDYMASVGKFQKSRVSNKSIKE